jgi:tryptophanyl-tRNA synthetase
VLVEAQALIPKVGRLPGVDGKAKMSKSQGNALWLSASIEEITRAVHRMYTDPNHLRTSDPGKVEGNVVFRYLDAFDLDESAVAELKAHYRRGGLGDMAVKRRLDGVLQALLAPIRERRAECARYPEYVLDAVREGTARARTVVDATLAEVREGLRLFRLGP